MKILANRINQQTGKREILLFVPRHDVETEHFQMAGFWNLAQEFHLNLDELDDYPDDDSGSLYIDEDTKKCEQMQWAGAWAGAMAQMEKGFLTRSDAAQKRMIEEIFKMENADLKQQFQKKTTGEFENADVQRWFAFFKQAFVLGAHYQGEYKETMWFEADIFKGI